MEGLSDLSIRSIVFDSEGRTMVGTANGVSRQNGDHFETVISADTGSFGIANFLLPLQDDTIIVGSNIPGLWLITSNGVEPWLSGPEFSTHSFSAALLDKTGQLWLGTSSGDIMCISRNIIQEKFRLEELNGSSINSFYMDADGTMWLATDRGIVSKRGNDFSFFSEGNGLPGNVVSSLCRDREGNLWVGTERSGLIKFSPGKFVNTSKDDGLISEAINGVTEDLYRSVWVATDEGISFFPSKEDPYSQDPKRRAKIDSIITNLKGIRVRQIRAEQDGSLWFATYSDYGLLVMYPDGKTRAITQKDGIPTNRVRFSFRASTGQLWIGTTAGPVTFEKNGPLVFGQDSGLPNLFILGMGEDANGNIWFGTDGGGVSRLDDSGFHTYTTADGLAGNVVFRIFRDSENRLWISTSEGLSLFRDGSFKAVNPCLDLANRSVYEVLEDKNGRLWIITANKVVLASANDLATAAEQEIPFANYRTCDRLDGLAGQLSANAWAFMNDRGIVYLPTLKGLSTYNPQSVQVNKLPPPVLVEKILADGTSVDIRQGRIIITADVRRLTFYYTALSFVIPQRVQFQYMLEGYDRDWLSAGTNREISYTNLTPGNYQFRIRAENNDGIINEEGASLSFRKKPHFYQTVPFYLTIGFILVLLGFLISWLRLCRLRKRAQELDGLVQERTAELEFEKEKSESLLMNILPPAIAEELKNTGHADPQVYQNTAVLFADIVGFTPWSAKMEPDDIIHELNDIFTNFDAIIENWGCERIKTLGDRYLACCGVSVSDADYARKLVHAGMDMLTYLENRNLNTTSHMEIRIGIDSGAIVGGVVGVKKYIFDIFGDTVNTAFRLESISVPMSLTVSEKVAALIGSEFQLIRRPERQIKGKGLVASFYVCRTGSNARSMNNASAIATKENARKLAAQGHFDEAFHMIEMIDYTVIEPEIGVELCELTADILTRLGATEKAKEFHTRAGRFDM